MRSLVPSMRPEDFGNSFCLAASNGAAELPRNARRLVWLMLLLLYQNEYSNPNSEPLGSEPSHRYITPAAYSARRPAVWAELVGGTVAVYLQGNVTRASNRFENRFRVVLWRL